MSLEIFLLGQFKLSADDRRIELSSRPAQSLLAYLTLNAGVTHRREKLATLIWPEVSEANARRYLRQALWRIHKSLESGSLNWENYLQTSDLSVTFDEQSDYWLDAEHLLAIPQSGSVGVIIEAVGLYRGELLPGFYEEWIVIERDRLRAAYHQKMNLLLDCLTQAERWEEALKWAEDWIRLGHSPESAFRALMNVYAGLGDQTMISDTYQRCVEALDRELSLQPSPGTQSLYKQLIHRGLKSLDRSTTIPIKLTDGLPPFLDDRAVEFDKPLFVARERELAILDKHLDLSLSGQARVLFITGEAGSGKTALLQEFTRRAQEAHGETTTDCRTSLVVAYGNCNAYTGIGDPYLPFREILELLTGDVEARWAAGAMTAEHARRLWNTLPITGQAVVEVAPDLIDTFIPGHALLKRASAATPEGADWLTRLEALVSRLLTIPTSSSMKKRDLFNQYNRVLVFLARKFPLLLILDDMQWADLGSISLLFHIGRHLTRERILIVCAHRPEEVILGIDKERHPLESLFNEFQR
ncbi:MAG: AAA family ATPase, partial [Anaerolineales bacterium]